MTILATPLRSFFIPQFPRSVRSARSRGPLSVLTPRPLSACHSPDPLCEESVYPLAQDFDFSAIAGPPRLVGDREAVTRPRLDQPQWSVLPRPRVVSVACSPEFWVAVWRPLL